MRIGSLSLGTMIKLALCFVFDFALLLAYVQFLALFGLVAPLKSLLVLAVLLAGLGVGARRCAPRRLCFLRTFLSVSASYPAKSRSYGHFCPLERDFGMNTDAGAR
ncbi:hypothetical protein IDH44_21750 [Paenibacillus sp. IB182496]|uniref:Uncharacterized protein n=1 Tax=Paenibacillus sabuli TaxID=2772509 RepID=A0A927BVX0_9BACL|nr:hypothetical protein [Paenibacillus sabuli]MBD2847827.1 hypothetical protein [Paenibacillus sabuli]